MKRLFLSLTFACLGLFVSTQAQTPAGYAIFGDVPYGYEDLSNYITYTSTNFTSGTLTGLGLNGITCQNNVAVSFSLSETKALNLTGNFALHIIASKTTATNKMEVSLCNGGWNAARVSWDIANDLIETEATNIPLLFTARIGDGDNTWRSHNTGNFAGGKNFTGEILRICAANGEQFEITQIYIDADATVPDPVEPAPGDEDAPASLTLAASNIRDNNVTLTASATDANSPITYTFYYKAEGAADFTAAGSVAAASGADAVKVVTGLAPETTYSFKVVATDPSSNSAEYTITNITTDPLYEVRYYFFRGNPASVTLPSEGITSHDLREGVGSTVGNGGGFTHSQKKYFTAFVNGGTGWWSFNQNLSSAKDMYEISQADWYLVVKFRTTITYGNFNIRLNNAVSYQNGQNMTYESDGSWNVLILALVDAKNTLSYSASQTGTVFQFHADGGAGYLDIAYAYLTNNAASVDDFTDNVAPVISSISDGDKTTSSVVLTVTASDDSGEDLTYIIKEGESVLTSTPATGASGSATAITVSGLSGQDHTLTVIARDGAGNEVSQNKVVTLPATVVPPSNLVVTTSNTDKSVTFTMSADDANPSLVYAILDGSDNVLEDNIAGTAGVETVYTLHGLTPETAYSFKVRVTNAASLFATSDVINITTNTLSEHRFYLTRGDNTDPLPESSSLTSTYVDCNVEFGNSSRNTQATDYISATTGNTWIAITLKPKAIVANDIDDYWYIVVRFRSNFSNNVFWENNFRLNLSNNAENWYVRIGDGEEPFGVQYNSNQWITLKKRIGDRRAGTAVPASYLQAGQVAVQMHVNANLIAGENIDIDYIYFTNDISDIDEGTDNSRRIKLDESEDISNNFFGIADNTPLTIDLQRSFIADGYWYTLCLPCSMTAEQIADAFGTCRIAHLSNSVLKSEDALYLDFEDVNTITAGQPYLFLPSADVINPLLCGTYKQNASRINHHDYAGMTGVYFPTDMSGMSDAYLLTTENTLAPVSGGTLKGFRAYFTLSTTPANGAPARIRFVTDTATSVDAITTISADKVIENGQLYIIRNGMKYNIQGQIVEPVK